MRSIVVSEWMTLDGVVQAPIHAGEDADGGFAHAGWHVPHVVSTEFQGWMLDAIGSASGFLFGRRTFLNLAAYWPNAPKEEQAIAGPLNTRPKYVVSTTLGEPTMWQNSTVVRRNVAEEMSALKQGDGGHLLVMGSTQLVATLMEHDLVDEFRLMIDPVLVGGGKRIFRDDGALRRLQLAESRPTSTGALLARYVRAES